MASKPASGLLATPGMGDGFNRAPTNFEPTNDRAWRHFASRVKRPIRHAFRNSKRFNHDILAGIPFILGVGYPSAVFRRIVAVVVDSVNLQTTGILHAGPSKERLEVSPLLANPNTAASVNRIVLVVWVVASLIHSVPNRIKRVFAAFSGIAPVDGLKRRNLGRLHAPARLGISQQLKSANQPFGSTLASARVIQGVVRPSSLTEFFPDRIANYNPSPKLIACFNGV